MGITKLLDSFGYYDVLLDKWDDAWSYYASGTWYWPPAQIGPYGRAGAKGLRFLRTEQGLRKGGFTDAPEWVIGVAIRPFSTATRHYLWVLEDITSVLVYAFIEVGGSLKICSGDPTNLPSSETLIAESSGQVAPPGWSHFETYIKLHASAGIIEVRKNGDADNPVIDLDSLNTIGGVANNFILGGEKWNGVDTEHWMCDLAVRTGVNTFIGDGRILWRDPTGAGSYTQWTGVPGTPNWDNVNEVPPDDDDGNESDTMGQIDTYAHAALPANTQSISLIAVNNRLAKVESGTRKAAAVLDIGGVVNIGADVVPSLGSYRYFQEVFDGPFDLSDADASKFGAKITA